jgi:hypothetical protein
MDNLNPEAHVQHPTAPLIRLLGLPKVYWSFLAILSLIAMAVAWFASAKVGPGVGTDGVVYLSSAENLLNGRGLVDYAGLPLFRWPPLYPSILALLAWIGKTTTFRAGWFLNILLFGGMIWLGGLLLKKCFYDNVFWAYIGSLIIAASSSLLSLAVTINTDLLFIVLAWGFLLVAGYYLLAPTLWKLLILAALANLAAMNRYTGATLAVTGFFLIVWVHRKNLRLGLATGLIFLILSLLSLAGWVIGHNYLLHDQFVGVYDINRAYFFDNLTNSLEKITHWFIPYSSVLFRYRLILFGGGILLGALLLFLDFTNKRQGRPFLRRVLQRKYPSAPFIFACILFSGIYLIFIFITASPKEISFPEYDRYQIVILPSVLAIVFSILDGLIEFVANLVRPKTPLRKYSSENTPAHNHNFAELLYLAIGVGILAWFVYPIKYTYDYVEATRRMGETRYNLYNTPAYSQSEIIHIAKGISRQSNLAIYSNYPAAAWLYLHRDIYPSPRDQSFLEGDTKKAIDKFQGWPGDKPVYLVWFLPNTYHHVLDVKTLKKFVKLMPVYKGSDGEIYLVKSPAPE